MHGLEESKEVLIGLDVGTQSTKAILYHPGTHKVLARSSSVYDLDESPITTTNTTTDTNHPPPIGRAEQSPTKWIHAVHTTLTNLSTTIKTGQYTISGIGVSGQQHGMVPLDTNFRIIRPAKLWCDVEASEESIEFSERAGEIMGCEWNVPAGFTAPKVLWMKRMEGDLWERVRWIVLPHDYVNLCLVTGIVHDNCTNSNDNDDNGNNNGSNNIDHDKSPLSTHIPTTDAGDASGTGLLGKDRAYIPDLANLIDPKYFAALPKILPSNAISGYLSPQWTNILQIHHNHPPIPISVGSGDNMCSALGCKCVTPGTTAVLSLGTSGTIFGVSDTPVNTGTPVAPFCDATGKFMPLVCVMSCTGVLNSVLEHWCSTPTHTHSDTNTIETNNNSMTHNEATTLAETIPAGCNGITFLPFLGAERTPNWPNSTGALLGLTHHNMRDSQSPGLLYRAAMEGITYLLAEALDQMRHSCGEQGNDNKDGSSGIPSGFRPTSLLVVGGGSKNHLWRQMIADVLGMELRFPLEVESAALGAAFQAGAAAAKVSVGEYVEGRNVEMEDIVVRPTKDEYVLELYRDGRRRYKEFSTKLYAN